MSGGKWDIILGGWGRLGKYFWWVVVSGDEWGWLHCLVMSFGN